MEKRRRKAMQFTPIDKSNLNKLAEYYKQCTYRISDYSAGIKIMWQNSEYAYAEACGCLLVKSRWYGLIDSNKSKVQENIDKMITALNEAKG